MSELSEGGGEQLGLFSAESDRKRRAVDEAADAINARFGTRSIRRGGTLH